MEPLQAGDLGMMDELGWGGFGTVYKGRSKKLGRDVAIKFLRGQSSEKFKNLMNEKDMMLKANDTYVLRVLATYEKKVENSVEYGLVMEYMHHGSLHLLFNIFNNNEDFVPWALRFQILHQVALAMTFLHSLTPPIIHCDLKPQNVLLDPFLNVRLTDFGLATLETSVLSSKAGTLSYMPPEALEPGDYKPTKEFDVYSFGILTWSVLSGREPYPECANWLEKMNKQYAEDILDVVFDVLKKLKDYFSKVSNKDFEMDSPKQNPMPADIKASRIEQFINNSRRDTTMDGVTVETIVFEDAERFLRIHFAAIIKAKPEWNYILDELVSQSIFTDEQVAHVRSSGVVQEQIRETLRMIMKQGNESCRTLLQLMNRHHPSLMRALAVPANVGPFHRH
ncbi:receptor-interacting serine/threonine-protein kinase 2-like isoform X2 [Aquarana catesbeiana]|uniref:receptor-interacting serine/threonine-protein kinase 2-like isoform X2 n=1 Tax=Aquarana catesbeiana TaxID=8400 RepID=UPI003CC9D66C